MDKQKANEPSGYSYPLLKKVFQNYASIPHQAEDLFLICCQHILEPQSMMFAEFIEFGFKPQNIFVLGKTYSTNKDILLELQRMGIHAVQPQFGGNAFDLEHRMNCEALSELIPQTAKCILLDDGGQLIETFVEKHRNVLFTVEQTSSGFRKLEGKNLPFPVINVARSTTKLIQESPFIAKHLFERIVLYFEDHKIIDPFILIVGLGPIGESLLQIFKGKNSNIEGFDIRLGHSDLLNKIKTTRPDVIIGATGSQILKGDDVESLVSDRPVYFISVSSSDREFPVAEFRSGDETHIDITYKNITFLNNGFPLSFIGNRNELPPAEIEKTICLLSGSIFYGVTKNVPGNGFVDIPEELENLINS